MRSSVNLICAHPKSQVKSLHAHITDMLYECSEVVGDSMHMLSNCLKESASVKAKIMLELLDTVGEIYFTARFR